MKYAISKEYLEQILNFLGTLPYTQVKALFDKLPENVEVIKEDKLPPPDNASEK